MHKIYTKLRHSLPRIYEIEVNETRVCHLFAEIRWILHNTSPADWAREVFKPSKDAENLLVSIKKELLSLLISMAKTRNLIREIP